MQDQSWWEENLANDQANQDAEHRAALRWLVEKLGSHKAAAKYLGVGTETVTRNLERPRMTRQMKWRLERQLAAIPRRHHSNPFSRLLWEVEENERIIKDLRTRVQKLESELQDASAMLLYARRLWEREEDRRMGLPPK